MRLNRRHFLTGLGAALIVPESKTWIGWRKGINAVPEKTIILGRSSSNALIGIARYVNGSYYEAISIQSSNNPYWAAANSGPQGRIFDKVYNTANGVIHYDTV